MNCKKHFILTRLATWLLCAWFLCGASYATAQKTGGNVGVGIQFGQPSGLSLLFYNPGNISIDVLAAWDLNDFFFLNVHGIWYSPISGSTNANFYYGPGAFIGIRDKNGRKNDPDNDVALGITGRVGINFFIKQLELFVHITPRLQLIERTDTDVGGGAGFRFYF